MWGPDLSGSEQAAGGVGGLVEVNDTASGTCFPAFDGNGNVSALIAANGGTNVARYEYGPFGELVRATGPMAKANPFRFSTKFQGDETDLLYYGYRDYNARTGRWLSKDPVLERAFIALNRREFNQAMFNTFGSLEYAFVQNNPICRLDVLGLSERDIQTMISKFMELLKTMCKDGRCCPDEGWMQNPKACLPTWLSPREGCSSQAVDVYVSLYPLVTGGGLDDTWSIESERINVFCPLLLYHNITVVTPNNIATKTGPHDLNIDKIIFDSWHGCYTITTKRLIFIPDDPTKSYWLYKEVKKCFTCRDLKNK